MSLKLSTCLSVLRMDVLQYMNVLLDLSVIEESEAPETSSPRV